MMKRKRRVSRTTLKIFELEDPFIDEIPTDIKTVDQATLHPIVVSTPNGGELVDPNWCDAPTRIQTDWETDALIEESIVTDDIQTKQ